MLSISINREEKELLIYAQERTRSPYEERQLLSRRQAWALEDTPCGMKPSDTGELRADIGGWQGRFCTPVLRLRSRSFA